VDERHAHPACLRTARPMSRVRHDGGEDGGASAAELTDISPGSTVTGLDEEELTVLRQVGRHWDRALDGRPAWVGALPIDPGLHQFPRSLPPRRGDRFTPIDFIQTANAAEIVATAHAGAGTSRLGSAASTWRRVLLGAPLDGSAVAHERMRKPAALAILSSDALSSVAYGPEAMLAVLALAGSGALGLSLEISVAIIVLMIAVGLSYRQLIKAYPHGGGSYIIGVIRWRMPSLLRRRDPHRIGDSASS
jgi:hypothetical protein